MSAAAVNNRHAIILNYVQINKALLQAENFNGQPVDVAFSYAVKCSGSRDTVRYRIIEHIIPSKLFTDHREHGEVCPEKASIRRRRRFSSGRLFRLALFHERPRVPSLASVDRPLLPSRCRGVSYHATARRGLASLCLDEFLRQNCSCSSQFNDSGHASAIFTHLPSWPV